MAERKNTGQEKENNSTTIKAPGADEQYLDLTSGKEPHDLTPRQRTCDVCGLTPLAIKRNYKIILIMHIQL